MGSTYTHTGGTAYVGSGQIFANEDNGAGNIDSSPAPTNLDTFSEIAAQMAADESAAAAIVTSVAGKLSKTSNLSDLTNTTTARSNLGLGTAAIQAVGAFDAAGAAATAQATSQPLDTELTALAGLTSATDRLPYFSGSGTAALSTFTPFARTLMDDTDALAARATLGTVALPASPPAFTVNGAAPAATTSLPAALGTFSGTLLTDALTAVSTLYARVDALEGLVRKLVELSVTLAVATSS